MKPELPDVNVLLALHLPDYPAHSAAAGWFGQAEKFATTPITEAGFVRLLLNKTIVNQQIAPEEAIEALRILRSHPKAIFWADDTSLAEPKIWLGSLRGHKEVTDLHLLNLAKARGGTLVTLDENLPAPLRTSERKLVRLIG
jgi:toxin-antitoxin system PIN domain toxin